MNETLWQALDYLRQGGWIMVPLGISSLAMWMLIIERFQAFGELTVRDISIDRAVKALATGELKSERKGLRASLLRQYLEKRSGSPELDARILQHCAMEQRGGLRRNLSFIAVLAAVAPLLGLLGTVLGMIETFQVISLFGTGNARAMAVGISVALVTTQSGLLVAIPGLLISHLLAKKAGQLQSQLDEITSILVRKIRLGAPMAARAKGARR